VERYIVQKQGFKTRKRVEFMNHGRKKKR